MVPGASAKSMGWGQDPVRAQSSVEPGALRSDTAGRPQVETPGRPLQEWGSPGHPNSPADQSSLTPTRTPPSPTPACPAEGNPVLTQGKQTSNLSEASSPLGRWEAWGTPGKGSEDHQPQTRG